jgi:hypothetical protein
MILFAKSNLYYKDYEWTLYAKNDPKVNGKPDNTIFSRNEGNEVIYLINKLMVIWSYRFVNTGNKIEKLIHDKMPSELTNQEEVQNWVEQNLRF